jgi:hypothetical protein
MNYDLQNELYRLENEMANIDPATVEYADLLNEWQVCNYEIENQDK